MTSGRYRIILTYILLLAIQVSITFAGTTGKISGKIIDKENGEPLPGVNVIVKGTTLGATTDYDGFYTILMVPPGNQTVVASMVGYSPVTVNGVQVHIDQTTPLNIELSPETIEIDELVIVAERNELKKDVSTSVAAVQSAEIETLPVSSINDVVGLQAGVEDGMVIRGGEADQALFQMDGVTLRDPRNNKPIASVALSSIQEVSIVRGGFNAEYGQVRSGIINIVTREGGVSEYYGSIQTRYSPATQKYFGMSVYDPNSMWNRPFTDPEVAWTGTNSWDMYTQRQYDDFEGWNNYSKTLLSDTDPNNDLSPAAAKKIWEWQHRRRPKLEPDYNIDASFGGPVPFISSKLGNLRFFTSFRFDREMLLIPLSRPDYKEFNWSLKVNSDINQSTKLMLTSSYGKNYYVAMNHIDNAYNNTGWYGNSSNAGPRFWNATDYFTSPAQIAAVTGGDQRAARIFTDSWYSTADVDHLTLSGKVTHFLSNSTLVEASIEHVRTSYLTGPIARRDTTKRYEVVPGYWADEAPFGYDEQLISAIDETNFFFGGHSATARDSSKLASYLAKVDLTSQVTNEHLIKAGVEFSYNDLDLNYGWNWANFKTANQSKGNWKPYRLSAYIQDKIEAYGFVANLGLRMDMSNLNTKWVDVDPFNGDYFSSSYNTTADYPAKDSETDIAFSPRVGISHPITENSKLFFNYGHFKQIPAYEEVLRVQRATDNSLSFIGNPNLIQAKTVSYELGYDHELFGAYLFQIAAFYNDISNQQGYTNYISESNNVNYQVANNNNYEDIRGLEITFRKTGGNWIRGFANYTYQVATQGAFGRQTINDNPSEQKRIDQNTPLLYQQKPIPQPRANLSLTLFTPKDFGPALSGFYPLEDWTLNVLGEWRAGEYLTYLYSLTGQVTSTQDIINNVQRTDHLNFDLRLSKTFDISRLKLTMFMEVQNVFNYKRLSGLSFYDSFDYRYYMESLHLPEGAGYENIPGDDRVGDYRRNGSKYQPIENWGDVMATDPNGNSVNDIAIYYDRATKKYFNLVTENGTKKWAEVDKARMDKILDDKAYIDMPNNSSFDFLNPRQIFFGINLSFTL